MSDDMVEKTGKTVDDVAKAASDVVEDMSDATQAAIKKAADVVEDVLDTAADQGAETVAEVKKTTKKATKAAAAQVEAATDATQDALAEGAKAAKRVSKKTAKTAEGAVDAVSADIAAMDAEVKKAAARARETIEEAVETGTATSADIRKALEDLVAAIENQRIFVDMRKSLDGAISAMRSSKTVDFVQQTATDTAGEMRRRPFRDTLQKLFFAGIGAAAMTRDEVEALVNRLVQRGDITEGEAEEMVEDVMESRKRQAARVEVEVDKRVKKALASADLPSAEDIEDLNAKIAALQRKVEELSKKVS